MTRPRRRAVDCHGVDHSPSLPTPLTLRSYRRVPRPLRGWDDCHPTASGVRSPVPTAPRRLAAAVDSDALGYTPTLGPIESREAEADGAVLGQHGIPSSYLR